MSDQVLIVGKGVAGTLLAFRCLQKKIPFQIIDFDSGKKSSAVASGLINPVVVKHFGLTWLAKEIIPEAQSFYKFIENNIDAIFFHPLEIFRVFHQSEQATLWEKRRKEESAEDFMKSFQDSPQLDYVNAPFGGGVVCNAAWVDVESFMKSTTQFFEKNNLLNSESFSFDDFETMENGWKYKDKEYSKVVFCQGINIKENPFFNWLPVNPLKGQLVKIENPNLPEDFAISKKVFILPLGQGRFKIGATYERTNEEGITEEGMSFLKEKFEDLIIDGLNFNITEKNYGFRPTVPDRRPILGNHPKYKNLWVFNGLGSKGYMLAPFFSQHLYDAIFSNQELMKEVDVKRYYPKN